MITRAFLRLFAQIQMGTEGILFFFVLFFLASQTPTSARTNGSNRYQLPKGLKPITLPQKKFNPTKSNAFNKTPEAASEKPTTLQTQEGSDSVTETKLIPLPIYSTLPNEGNTFGFMPVFLVVEKESGRTQSIIAPSVSWNPIIRLTHTFRWYFYPSNNSSLTVIPSVSSKINRNLTLEFNSAPQVFEERAGQFTYDASLHMRRSVFHRFFGLGPEAKTANETSFTKTGGDTAVRLGYNLSTYWNLGVRLGAERWLTERRRVDFLPLTHDRFTTLYGLQGSTVMSEGLSLRYDSRPYREFSDSGSQLEFAATTFQGLSNSSNFVQTMIEAKHLFRLSERLSAGVRGYYSYVIGGAQVPFYFLSTLGGSNRLRGFTEDRFIDRGAWTVELEPRLQLFQTRIYGVVADWRIDPFIALGQVFTKTSEAIAHTRVSGGLGFRAFVRPNVVGRVDLAAAGDGLKVYVELGYPF